MGLIDNIAANGKLGSLGLVGLLTGLVAGGAIFFFYRVVLEDSLNPEWSSLSAMVHAQDQVIDSLTGRIPAARHEIKARERSKAEAEALLAAQTRVQNQLSQKTEQLRQIREDTESIARSFAAYRSAYHDQARQAAAGEAIPLLILRSGKRYENVTLLSVESDGIHLAMPDGSLRIPIEELDSSWHRRFGWDE